MKRLTREKAWVAAALLFALYATFLLWKIYSTHDQLQADVLTELRLETEKRGEAASYFLSERQNDLQDLADAQETANFFVNRDLGMSMEYGLALSAQSIEDKFNRLEHQKLLGGKPIYRDIALIDAQGELVAGGTTVEGRTQDYLDPNSRGAAILFRPSEKSIIISAPVWYRGQYRGQVVAWSDLPTFLSQLLGSTPGGGLALVDDRTGEPLGVARESRFLVPDVKKALAGLKTGGVRMVSPPPGLPRGENVRALLKVAIPGSPMALARVVSEEQLEQRATPVGLLLAAGAVPLLVLAGAVGFASQARRHRALAAEKGRLEGRNTELEQEVARRLVAEAELRQRSEELQHAYARAEAASHAKSQFLANMAHEIRTPMNGVLGMTELMLDGELSEEQRGYAEIVMSSGHSLLTVLNDILDYSKIEAGMMKVEALAYNPREAATQVVALFQKLAEAKGLAYHLKFSESFPTHAVGDPTRVRQVLTNLISNAIKFTQAGGVTVHADTCEREGRACLAFTVTDTGIGMDQATRDGLFQAFSQADGSITRRFGGTGLGLTIARRLCELLGGHITVKSAPDEGSSFRFEIPIEARN